MSKQLCPLCNHDLVGHKYGGCRACDCPGEVAPFDPVNRPEHYAALDPEPITVIENWQLGFCVGNALKYIARAGHKDPSKTAEDLRKAIWYLDREATRLEKQGK